MIAKNKVVYVPPVYEEVQHEVTSVDDKNNPLRTSFHSDISLMTPRGVMSMPQNSAHSPRICLLITGFAFSDT